MIMAEDKQPPTERKFRKFGQLAREEYRYREAKFKRFRPTHKQVSSILERMVEEQVAIVIAPGRPGKATKYRWSDEDGSER